MYTDTLLRVIIMKPLRWGWETDTVTIIALYTPLSTDMDIIWHFQMVVGQLISSHLLAISPIYF